MYLKNVFLKPTVSDTIQSLVPPDSSYFNLNRNNLDLGTRDEKNRRDTYRIVVGAQGTFNDDWHYDVSFNYGHLKTKSTFYNNRIEQNFYNAIDAVFDGAGNIRSEEHTSELQSLMRISYAVFCLKTNTIKTKTYIN